MSFKRSALALTLFGMVASPAYADSDTPDTKEPTRTHIDCERGALIGKDTEIIVHQDATLPGCFTARENAERALGRPIELEGMLRPFLSICSLQQDGLTKYFAAFGPSVVDVERSTKHWSNAAGAQTSIEDLEMGYLPAVLGKLRDLHNEGTLSEGLVLKMRELEKAEAQMNDIESGTKNAPSCRSLGL